MTVRRTARLLAAAAAVFALAACRDDGTAPDLSVIDHVVVEAPRTSITVGDSVQLTATAFDGEGNQLTRIPFSWASEDPAVVIVNATGGAKGLSSGTGVIRATAGDKSGMVSLTVR